MLASVPIDHAAELVQDVAGVAYTPAQMLSWFNESQRVIASIKPQASMSTTTLLLTANETKHSLASGQNSIVDVLRNMGSDGSTPGDAIRMIKDRQALEDAVPDWHSATGAATIESYYYDIRNPKVLWTYPRAHATTAVYIEGVFSVTPADVTATTDAITITEEFEPAAVNWIVFRCLSRDSRRTPLWNRAMANLTIFGTLIGLEIKGNVLNDPRIAEHLHGPGQAALASAETGAG